MLSDRYAAHDRIAAEGIGDLFYIARNGHVGVCSVVAYEHALADDNEILGVRRKPCRALESAAADVAYGIGNLQCLKS